MIGQSLLHYKVLSKLGEGGMGEVFLALDTKLERQVALKVLPEEMAGNSRRWQRFVREARVIAALNHPNIITIYAVEEADGRHFFAMELVEGETLERLIPRNGLELDRFFAIATPLVDALAAAHRQGILHRDLKPDNVMLARDGRVKVLDFGVAKTIGGHDKTEAAGIARRALTEEGSVLGTARYMSPEQACGEPVDARTDIFSLGIVLFEMATGGYPFQGRTAPEVLSSILRDEPPLAHALRRELPGRLGALIHRCLQKTAELRYGSAEELGRDLDAVRREAAAAPAHEGLERTVAEPVARVRAGERSIGGSVAASVTNARATPALAVLPLTDLGGGPDYFVEGLTEELITAVAKVGSLRVISRQSVMRYRGSDKLLSEIARELGVDHVLEGSVLRAGDRVRISLQLIRADPEEHLWAERYERDIGDVLSVQSEVARAVAAEIRGRLTTTDDEKLIPPKPVAAEVLEAYLKGRHYWRKRTLDGLEKAVACFQQAIEADPTHAASHAGLAESWAIMGQFRPGFGALAARAKAAARKAVELDPSLADAHVSLGFVSFFYEWNWAQAEAELKRGIELAPSHANAHHWYWSLLMCTGRRDEARREIRRAVELDPLSPLLVTNYGLHHHLNRNYDRALEQLGKALDLEPTFLATHLNLWRVHELRGAHDEAVVALRAALLAAGHADIAATLGEEYPRLGYGPAVAATADRLAHEPASRLPIESSTWMYLADGQIERALALVEESFEKRRAGLVWMAVAPDWDPLEKEPRFHQILELVGLPPRASVQLPRPA
jgi:TolB-like protein